MKTIAIKSEEYDIELLLRSNITVIMGNTATGKSFFYELMNRQSDRDDIICINYDSIRSTANYAAMVSVIEKSKEKIFVIDQADDIQRKDEAIMYAINTDNGANNFIVIGRNPKLTYNISDLAEISIRGNKISLSYLFPQPLM